MAQPNSAPQRLHTLMAAPRRQDRLAVALEEGLGDARRVSAREHPGGLREEVSTTPGCPGQHVDGGQLFGKNNELLSRIITDQFNFVANCFSMSPTKSRSSGVVMLE